MKPTNCQDCDAPLTHPLVGRPRVVCPECRAARHRASSSRTYYATKHTAKYLHRQRERDRLRYAEDPERRADSLTRTKTWMHAHPEAMRAWDHQRRCTERLGDVDARAIKTVLDTTKLCSICRRHLNADTGRHIDHIIPLGTGGRHTLTNLRVTCATCNLTRPKDGRDVTQLVIA